MKKTMALMAVLALLAACETMAGLGRDTQKAGESLSRAAEANK